MTEHNAKCRNRPDSCGYRGGRSGQGLIEFALVLIVLLTMICAIFEFSWVMYNLAYLNNAVAKGVRSGEVLAGSTTAYLSTVIASTVTNQPGGLPISIVSVTDTTQGSGTVSAGDIITVTAGLTYNNITPLSHLVQMSAFSNLKISAQGRVE